MGDRTNGVSVDDVRGMKAAFGLTFPVGDQGCGCHVFGGTSMVSPLPIVRNGPRRLIGRVGGGPIGARTTSVLVIRSGVRLHAFLLRALSRSCRISSMKGKRRTLSFVGRQRPSLVLSSMVVPVVGKGGVYGVLGDGVRADRVPVVLLATLGSGRDVVGNLRAGTSGCVIGPFSVRMLGTGVAGILTGERVVGGHFSRFGFGTSRMSSSPAIDLRRRFLLGTASVVGDDVGGRVGMRGLYSTVGVDQDDLCGGVGTLAGSSPDSFVHGMHVGRTDVLLGDGHCAMSRISSVVKFDSPGCFASAFGGCCKIPPDACVGRGWGGRFLFAVVSCLPGGEAVCC